MRQSRMGKRDVVSNRGGVRLSTWGVVVLVCCALWFVACDRETDLLLDRLKELEADVYRDQDLSKKTVDELKAGIRLLRNEVDRTVKAGQYLGTYYKLVAVRYLDRRMYGLAAEFFSKAVEIEPANPYLSYQAGVCTAQLARSEADLDERRSLFWKASRHYRYAIDIDPSYVSALYALSVLYVFELEEPREAESYLLTIVSKEARNYRAMFLLARVYVETGRSLQAVGLYDRIIAESSDRSMVDQARENRRLVLGVSDAG